MSLLLVVVWPRALRCCREPPVLVARERARLAVYSSTATDGGLRGSFQQQSDGRQVTSSCPEL